MLPCEVSGQAIAAAYACRTRSGGDTRTMGPLGRLQGGMEQRLQELGCMLVSCATQHTHICGLRVPQVWVQHAHRAGDGGGLPAHSAAVMMRACSFCEPPLLTHTHHPLSLIPCKL